MPQVSVIVPNYNHAKYLPQRIDSILAQSYTDFELIMLDDCSTDNSREVMERYRGNAKVSHIVYNTENSGSTFKQWEKGIALSSGEYIWIAESDDWAKPDFLEAMLKEIQKNPFASLVYSIPNYTNEDTTLWSWQPPVTGNAETYNGNDFICSKLVYCNVVHNASTAIFRKSSCENIVYKHYQDMKLCGDWLFYVLLAEQGDVIEVSRHLSYFRRHDKSVTPTAVKNGLALLEGMDVLAYIRSKVKISTNRKYISVWAKRWAIENRLYQFSPSINKKIKKRADKVQKWIYFLFLLFSLMRVAK